MDRRKGGSDEKHTFSFHPSCVQKFNILLIYKTFQKPNRVSRGGIGEKKQHISSEVEQKRED